MHLPDFSRTVKLLFKALFWLHLDVLSSQLCEIPNSWLSHFTFCGLWIIAAVTGRSNECLWRLGTIYLISGEFLFQSHAFYDLSSELHCSLGNKQKVKMRYKPTPAHQHTGIYISGSQTGNLDLTEQGGFPPVSVPHLNVVIPAQTAFIQIHGGEVQDDLERQKGGK